MEKKQKNIRPRQGAKNFCTSLGDSNIILDSHSTKAPQSLDGFWHQEAAPARISQGLVQQL